MARAIRLNTASGATASSGSSGLSQAQVETVVEDKARWILAYEADYSSSGIPTGYLPLIQTVDFDNVAAYHCIMRGFGPTSSQSRLQFKIMSGSSDIAGNSNWSYQAVYGNSQYNGTGGNTSFSNGNFQPSAWTDDSVATGGAQNHKEITFFFNRSTAPSNGSRYFEADYLVHVPAPGGYQSYGSRSFHKINASAEFNRIDFGFGGTFYDPTNAGTTPSVQVYKQLRAPAT